jgi:hypothetical protein
MRFLTDSRSLLSLIVATLVGAWGIQTWPWPGNYLVLAFIQLERPTLAAALQYSYTTLWFTSPFFATSLVLSAITVFAPRRGPTMTAGPLPTYPDPKTRRDLSLVLGEQHTRTSPAPVAEPKWLVIPERGLYAGTAIVGAIGTGKTSACLYPYIEQLLAYGATDPARKLGGLVLEVKGDFCRDVERILARHDRAGDYVEVSLNSPYRYNPLHHDLDAYALAFGLATLITNLYGRGDEPFWQQASTNLMKFIILLHHTLEDYVTLVQVYYDCIDPNGLAALIAHGEQRLVARRAGQPATPADAFREEQFQAVKRWFHHDWMRIEPKLRTSIVEGISVFLSVFDDNPLVKHTFCPPKELYDPAANPGGALGTPLPPIDDLIEQGKVVALNFPTAMNPGLARILGTLLKLDFQRAVLSRIAKMPAAPSGLGRPVVFFCDEYQAFATTGENEPSGDEKFFSLARQARCIPIVATQSLSSLRSALRGESWRTLLQGFRTKIFLALSDDFSAQIAADLCGKVERLKPSFTFTEAGQDAKVSLLTGRSAAHKATVSATKTYAPVSEYLFQPKIFAELPNGQAIVLPYDGLRQHPPTFCFLKPHYLNVQTGYFEYVEKGEL